MKGKDHKIKTLEGERQELGEQARKMAELNEEMRVLVQKERETYEDET